MNTINLLRHALACLCFIVASAFILSTLAYLMRRQLRMIFDRWRALGKFGQCVTLVFVLGFIAYGGTKHQVQRQRAADGGGTPSLPSGDAYRSEAMWGQRISEWTARGAWEDWKRIEFPDGFIFPIGTNAISEVMLMSKGSLRFSLTNDTPLVALPYDVSLEPDVSSVSYGLTTSNSLLFVWENVCVARDATNRVDATIELFATGDLSTRVVQHSTGNVLHSTFTSKDLPEGWMGEGQDASWATNAFPEFAENIATNGYDNWLTDHIGVNEANGRYKVMITIGALPMNGSPCYLECGPYRVIVKQPGTYSFPLEYFQEYTVRTYPEALPLTFEYDEGLQLDEGWGCDSATSARMPRRRAPAASSNGNTYKIDVFPQVFIRPNYIPLDQAYQRQIEIFCKGANITSYDYTSVSGRFRLFYTSPSDAVILEALTQERIVFRRWYGDHLCTGTLTIGPASSVTPPDSGDHQPSTNEWDDVIWTNDTTTVSN